MMDAAHIVGLTTNVFRHLVYEKRLIPAPQTKCGRRYYYTAEEMEKVKKAVKVVVPHTDEELTSMHNAAKITGISAMSFSRFVKTKVLPAPQTKHLNRYYYDAEEMEKLKDVAKSMSNALGKGLISIHKATQIVAVKPTTFSNWLAEGLIPTPKIKYRCRYYYNAEEMENVKEAVKLITYKGFTSRMQAAKLTGIQEHTFRRLVEKGVIPAPKIKSIYANRYYYTPEEMVEVIKVVRCHKDNLISMSAAARMIGYSPGYFNNLVHKFKIFPPPKRTLGESERTRYYYTADQIEDIKKIYKESMESGIWSPQTIGTKT